MSTLATSLRARARRLAVFAVAGAALWLGQRVLQPEPEPTALVVHVRSGADATERERAIDEAVLVESALALGLPWSDPYVRARMLADLREADPSTRATDDEVLLAHARRLELARAHPVVRARIAAAMLRRIDASAQPEPPGDTVLSAYLDAHRERYAQPSQLDVVQVFVSRDRHGDRTDAVARALGERPELLESRGDPSLLPRELVAASPARIDATFGPGIAAALEHAATGSWVGPLRGSYGLHWMRVDARRPAGVPELGLVIDRVRRDWFHDRQQLERRRRLLELRERYDIRVQEPEAAP